MKRIYPLVFLSLLFFNADAQDLDFGVNYTLDITDPCSISGTFEISYDDEMNSSYPTAGPFLTYLKLINTSNDDVQVPTTIMELNSISSGATQGYSFSNVDVTSIFGFTSGQEYRIQLHIDPSNQVYESDFITLDTMTIGYTTCNFAGVEDKHNISFNTYLNNGNQQLNIVSKQKYEGKIFNISGRVVKTLSSEQIGENLYDISEFKKGVYFIKLYSDGKTYSTKFIK